MTTECLIEALLFMSGEPMTVQSLASVLQKPRDEMLSAIHSLEESLQGRGVRLISHESKVSLVTAPEASEFTSEFMRETLHGNLSRAALETLTIILYRSPLSRAKIDYLRGVNSTYTIHTLLTRGLIERVPDANDARVFLYKPSIEFMKYTGITSLKLLPEYETLKAKSNENPPAEEETNI